MKRSTRGSKSEVVSDVMEKKRSWEENVDMEVDEEGHDAKLGRFVNEVGCEPKKAGPVDRPCEDQ